MGLSNQEVADVMNYIMNSGAKKNSYYGWSGFVKKVFYGKVSQGKVNMILVK
jgi:hypothetical protein